MKNNPPTLAKNLSFLEQLKSSIRLNKKEEFLMLIKQWVTDGGDLNAAFVYTGFTSGGNSILSIILMDVIKPKNLEWVWDVIDKYKINLLHPFNGHSTLLHRMPYYDGQVAIGFLDEWCRRGLALEPETGVKHTPLGVLLTRYGMRSPRAKEILVRMLENGADLMREHRPAELIYGKDGVVQCVNNAPAWTFAIFEMVDQLGDSVNKKIIDCQLLILNRPELQFEIDDVPFVNQFNLDKKEPRIISAKELILEMLSVDLTVTTKHLSSVVWALFKKLSNKQKCEILDESAYNLFWKNDFLKGGEKQINLLLEDSSACGVFRNELLKYIAIEDRNNAPLMPRPVAYKFALDYLVENKAENEKFIKENTENIIKTVLRAVPSLGKEAVKCVGEINLSKWLGPAFKGVVCYSEDGPMKADFWTKEWLKQHQKSGLKCEDVGWLKDLDTSSVLYIQELLENACENKAVSGQDVYCLVSAFNENVPGLKDFLAKLERFALLDMSIVSKAPALSGPNSINNNGVL